MKDFARVPEAMLVMTQTWFVRLQARAMGESEEGQSLVEMAMVLPVLLLVVTGILTFGLALNNYITLTEATSVGARQIAIMRSQGGDPCSIAAQAIATAAPILKNTGNSTTGMAYSFQVYTSSSTSTTYNASTPSCPNAALTQNQPVTVTVTYPCNVKVYKANYVPSCYLTAQTTEVVQ